MAISDSLKALGPRLSLSLLCAFLIVLWIAGGASRADVIGQVVVRSAAWGLLAVFVLWGRPPAIGSAAPIVWLLTAAVITTLVQLVPLPPAVWQALPGRDLITEAADSIGTAQPWRPLSIVPPRTLNAAGSLVVPAVVLLLGMGLTQGERKMLLIVILSLVTASTLLDLLQFGGVPFDNRLVNLTSKATGTFANRNHLALFVAMGCLIAPVWAFDRRRPGWRIPVAVGLLALFVLMILASGSRAGLALGIVALGLGLLIVARRIRDALDRMPRWALPVLLATPVAFVGSLTLLTVLADRAESIGRLFALDPAQDMRRRGMPVILDMIATYFPAGTGLGGFDPLFRIHEPFDLLKPTYLNHAHNDFLEIALDAGIAGILLLGAGVAWWAWASFRAWRAGAGSEHTLPKVGSALLLLVMIASMFDYPARTPLIMAMVVIAALWLSGAPKTRPARLYRV